MLLAKQEGMREGVMKIKCNHKRGYGRGQPLTSRVLRGLVKEIIPRPLMTEHPPNELNAMQSMKNVEYVTRTPRDITRTGTKIGKPKLQHMLPS